MPALLFRLKIKDSPQWRLVFEEDRDIRRSLGCREELIYCGVNDPEEVWILLEWDDLFRARLFAKSDELVNTWVRAGVNHNPEIWFLDGISR